MNPQTLVQEVDIQSRRYLGNKTRLLDFIESTVRSHIPEVKSFIDIFSGTGAVAERFNRPETGVLANDLLPSNEVCLNAWLGPLPVRGALLYKLARALAQFAVPEKSNESNFCQAYGDRYFSKERAAQLWSWRLQLEVLTQDHRLNLREKDVLLAGMLYTADRHALTFGHYEAFQKKPGADRPLIFLLPRVADHITNRKNAVVRIDANALAPFLRADVAYLDPPYNSRQYGAAYHLLDVLAQGVVPTVQGVSRKPADRLAWQPSAYCVKAAPQALRDLVDNLDCKFIVMSYSNMENKGDGRSNAKISGEEILETLSNRGKVTIESKGHKAFSTGKTSLSDHQELLYVCQVATGQ
jgi:adenine-specific DNA-methyltransferase